MCHADAGYETAKQCAREHDLNLPMLDILILHSVWCGTEVTLISNVLA